MTAAVVDRLEKRLSDTVVKADGKCQVTVAMLKTSHPVARPQRVRS